MRLILVVAVVIFWSCTSRTPDAFLTLVNAPVAAFERYASTHRLIYDSAFKFRSSEVRYFHGQGPFGVDAPGRFEVTFVDSTIYEYAWYSDAASESAFDSVVDTLQTQLGTGSSYDVLTRSWTANNTFVHAQYNPGGASSEYPQVVVSVRDDRLDMSDRFKHWADVRSARLARAKGLSGSQLDDMSTLCGAHDTISMRPNFFLPFACAITAFAFVAGSYDRPATQADLLIGTIDSASATLDPLIANGTLHRDSVFAAGGDSVLYRSSASHS